MKDKHAILHEITSQGMLPLFYYEDPAVCLQIIETLYKGGIRAVEYTNRGPAALDNFTYLKSETGKRLPGLALGIGTVRSPKDAAAFVAAGADFVVSPVVNSEVAAVVKEAGLLWVPGCMTPTEIDVAEQLQALLIKLFPADLLKPDFVQAIQELFPGQLFMPTGGIELDKAALAAWFKAGVCAVGMGSKLISKSISNEQLYDDLYNDTLAALMLVRQAKEMAGLQT